MSRRLVLVLWLVMGWVLLWEGLSVANVVGGAAVAVALVLAFPPRNRAGRWRVRPVATARLMAHFVVKLLQANAVVAWEVLTPSNHSVNEGIVRVPLDTESPGIVTLVANAVSLTPGTLTVDVEESPPVLYVHVLHLTSPEQARDEVRRFEQLAVAAFSPGEADQAPSAPTPTAEDPT